jgi:tRNA/tmRNA/rRNA uracil-C5-methylase (TrmA/RlmC/RlmD family)
LIQELRIDSLAALGEGVGRTAEGRVVFVPFTAPGDVVRVEIVEDHGRFARGTVRELVRAGSARTSPACPVFGSCGGCAWQHVTYEVQIEEKRRILREALVRIGGVAPELLAPLPFTPSPSPYAYRGRTRVLVARGRVGYRRRRSRALAATDRCPILVPPLQDALRDLARHPPPDGEWELAAPLGPQTGDAVARVPCAPRGRAASPDAEKVRLRVGPDELRVSAGSFAQSNHLLVETLARAVQEAAGSGERALELFAGGGLLTLGLARRFETVTAIEGDATAARDLSANAAAAGLGNVRLVEGAVERCLPAAARALGGAPDVVVLDPPRSGLPGGCHATLVRLGPARLVYLSCDPATLARDVAVFRGLGFRFERAAGFDLFPHTPHVEALVSLARA